MARTVSLRYVVSEPNSRADRRGERREMHIDRRKSGVDLIEHVMRGVQAANDGRKSRKRPARKVRRK